MSLLIEALKQAEARKGPKAGQSADKPAPTEAPAAQEGAAEPTTPSAAEHAAAAAAATTAEAGGLSLSLAPQDERAAPSAAAPDPARTEASAQPPTPASPAAPPATEPQQAPAAKSSAAVAPPAPAAAAPAAAAVKPANAPGGAGRLQTGSDAARRTAREVLASGQSQGRSASARWRHLLGALAVLAVLLAGGLWWLTRQTSSELYSQLPTAPAGAPATDPSQANTEAPLATPPEAMAVAPEAELAAKAADSAPLASPTGSGETAPPADAPAPPPAGRSAATVAELGEPTRGHAAAPSATASAPLLAAPATGVTPAPSLRIERARQAQQPLLSAYAALNRGELAAAARDYRRALQLHPGHPDALLGLAVIAEREGDLDAAARRYREVLRADPRNSIALAALLGSARGAAEQRSESQLREALAAAPRAPALHLALGNLLAAGGRWDQAQQAYFDAAVLAPDDPDIVFNLGVALDRLHKPRLALEQYLRAEELRRARPANYDPHALAARISALSQRLAADGARPR